MSLGRADWVNHGSRFVSGGPAIGLRSPRSCHSGAGADTEQRRRRNWTPPNPDSVSAISIRAAQCKGTWQCSDGQLRWHRESNWVGLTTICGSEVGTSFCAEFCAVISLRDTIVRWTVKAGHSQCFEGNRRGLSWRDESGNYSHFYCFILPQRSSICPQFNVSCSPVEHISVRPM